MVAYYPIEMCRCNRWGLWKKEFDGKRTNKIPWDPVHWRNAKSNDRSTWCSYSEARQYFHMQPDLYGGPTFFTGDSWCLLDLDHIKTMIADHNLGEHNLIDDVQAILGNTYCELSQSGEGLHFIFCVNDSVDNFGVHKKKKINGRSRELYHEMRFIALTGTPLNEKDSQQSISTIDHQQFKRLYELVFEESFKPSTDSLNSLIHTTPKQKPSPAAKYIMQRILSNADGRGDDQRLRTWLDKPVYPSTREAQAHGVYDFDHSSEDMACCNMLAYWTGCDPQLMDEIFRQTQLYRSKWDRMTGSQTYGEMTIAAAITRKRGNYNFDFSEVN